MNYLNSTVNEKLNIMVREYFNYFVRSRVFVIEFSFAGLFQEKNHISSREIFCVYLSVVVFF